MSVWLWEAPGPARCATGVSRARSGAQLAAQDCLISGQAASATIQEAELVNGADVLTSCYRPIGERWQASRTRGGVIRWHPLPTLAAS